MSRKSHTFDRFKFLRSHFMSSLLILFFLDHMAVGPLTSSLSIERDFTIIKSNVEKTQNNMWTVFTLSHTILSLYYFRN